MGQSDPRAVLRPCGTRGGARRRRRPDVRRRVGRGILCYGPRRQPEGFRTMTDVAPVRARTGPGPDFFDRARRRLSFDVPAALDDPNAPATRGDLDLDPESWKKAGVVASKP